MKTLNRLLLVAWVAALSCQAALWAETPARTTGRVLLLENERLLEGEITREGERFRIRRSMGESWVPAAKALRLCADMNEAYHYLRGRTNLRDADERMKLARWCQLHQLRDQALAEAQAAVELRPRSAEAQRLLRMMERVVQTAATSQEPLPTDISEPPATFSPGVNLTLEALSKFSTRVQPILMNACASCHVSGRGGAFKLIRSGDDGKIQGRSTQQNLAAVLEQVNPANWQASPLLTKAVSVHGDSVQPPLKGRQTPAYHALADWVQLAASEVPPSEAAARVPAKVPVEPRPFPKEVVAGFHNVGGTLPGGSPRTLWAVENDAAKLAEPIGAPKEHKPAVADAEPTRAEEKTKDSQKLPRPASVPAPAPPAPTAEPTTDPFDPLIFNRQMHPERK